MKKLVLLILTSMALNGCFYFETKVVRTVVIRETPRSAYSSTEPYKVPSTLKISILVAKGKVRKNKLIDFSYPGRVEKSYYIRLPDGRVKVYLRSTYNSKIQWSMILPQKDGEHLIIARREY